MAYGRGGFGGFGGGNQMQQLMKQAQKMQEQMQQAQEELEEMEIEGESGSGLVKVVVNGKKAVQSISIDPKAVDPEDVEMLQDMIIAAVNQGLADAQAMVNDKISAVAGGLNIPGLFQLT